MLVALSLLAVPFSFLIYHNPPSTWLDFIARFSPSVARNMAGKSQRQSQDGDDPDSDQQTILPDHRPLLSSSPRSTPKALPQDASNASDASKIPRFMLNEDETLDHDDADEDNLPPPSFPALNSVQRASGPAPSRPMLPPSKPRSMTPSLKPTASSLMPPPRVAPSNLSALPTSPQSTRMLTTGPLPNRRPASNRNVQPSNGWPGPPPSANDQARPRTARDKVLLSPGHSPLDWAKLQRAGENLSGVHSLLRVPPSLLKEKNGRKGKPAWSSYHGKVYNISPYLPFHPGGEGELRRAAGKDGAKLFMEVHPWVNWENMLGECVVGILVSEEQAAKAKAEGDGLEDMD